MPDKDLEGKKIDPPDNQSGGGAAVASIDADDDENPELAPIDPPDNQGGG